MDDLLPRRKGAERRAALTPHADVICDGDGLRASAR